MTNNIEKLYKEYPVLKKIDKDLNGLISEKAIYKELLAGDKLSTYGSSCVGFLFVLRGDINIKRLGFEGEETNLYNIGKGELCHEALSCFLRCEPLNIIGKATQDSQICIIPFEIMQNYLLNNADFLKIIYRDLHSKFNLIIELKEKVKHEPLEKRLVKLLISKQSKNIYSTHAEIAFELDSAREVISRRLKELEKEGYVKLTRGKIQIVKDLNELI